MKSQNKHRLVSAAVAGLLSAAALAAHAADGATGASGTAVPPTPAAVKGNCIGANSCKGKSACSVQGANDCAGQNTCKGKGWIETSKADCDALARKDKKIKFVKTG